MIFVCLFIVAVSKENKPKFVFETDSWQECIINNGDIVELTTGIIYTYTHDFQVFRQDDKEFVGLLSDIRKGICTRVINTFYRLISLGH